LETRYQISFGVSKTEQRTWLSSIQPTSTIATIRVLPIFGNLDIVEPSMYDPRLRLCNHMATIVA